MNARKTIPKANPGLFDHVDWTQIRSQDNTILDRLLTIVDFEAFRGDLEAPLIKQAKGPGGRPAFDAVLMFKVLIAQRVYGGLSDDAMEFEIRDRESIRRFLDLSIVDQMPDSKTIWKYREDWTNSGTFDRCSADFLAQLADRGIKLSPGKMIDASFVEVPIQRNSRDDNQHIKDNDEAPPNWDDEPNKKRQKDVDARHAKKGNTHFFGYKLHALVDTLGKYVAGIIVTPANVHDSQAFLDLLDPSQDQEIYADSAYRSKAIFDALEADGIAPQICERAYRGKPLSEEQKTSNRAISHIRARVEHVFGHMTGSLNLMRLRCIGLARVTGMLTLGTLVYNMQRLEQMHRLNLAHA